MRNNKIKTFEFFTPYYNVIIPATSAKEAMEKFVEKYNDQNVILVIDTQYFALKGKVIELKNK